VVAANWNRWAIDKALQKAPKTAVKQQNSTTTRPVNMQGEQTHPSTSNGFIPDFTRFKTDIRNAFSRSINSVSQETKDSNRKTFERLKQVAEDAGYNVTTWVADVRTPATRKIKGKIKVVQEFDVQITLTKSQTA
jgi:hypothetical protein